LQKFTHVDQSVGYPKKTNSTENREWAAAGRGAQEIVVLPFPQGEAQLGERNSHKGEGAMKRLELLQNIKKREEE